MEHLLASMKIVGDDKIQRTQLKHRQSLVNAFGLEEGMRILEIGCGQGDTTIVLADAVGEEGYVLAVDIASPAYGAPVTVGEATSAIAASEFGRVDSPSDIWRRCQLFTGRQVGSRLCNECPTGV